jgi:hypothetical protein
MIEAFHIQKFSCFHDLLRHKHIFWARRWVSRGVIMRDNNGCAITSYRWSEDRPHEPLTGLVSFDRQSQCACTLFLVSKRTVRSSSWSRCPISTMSSPTTSDGLNRSDMQLWYAGKTVFSSLPLTHLTHSVH